MAKSIDLLHNSVSTGNMTELLMLLSVGCFLYDNNSGDRDNNASMKNSFKKQEYMNMLNQLIG